jgi:hypothetical protein
MNAETIPHSESKIVDVIRDRQRAMRREIDRRHILMKVVAQDSGISYTTLLTYFPADEQKTPVQICGSAIFALTGHLPADILSLLLPEGHLIVRAPVEMDHHEIADMMGAWLVKKQHAHHPQSEAGPEIGPNEDRALREGFALIVGGRGA